MSETREVSPRALLETDEAAKLASASPVGPAHGLAQTQITQNKQHYDDDADDIEDIHDNVPPQVDFTVTFPAYPDHFNVPVWSN